MTGYGKSVCKLPNQIITIDIKSLNSNQINIETHLPSIFKEKEFVIRDLLAKKLERGRINFTILIEITREEKNYKINTNSVKSYFNDLKQLSKELKISDCDESDLLEIVMRLPDIFQYESEQLSEQEWIKMLKAIDKAIDALDKFRIREGKVIEADFIKRINLIRRYLIQIEKYDKKRLLNIKKKIHTDLSKYLSSAQSEVHIDKSRFEQELIYYLEKIDIIEEKVRLLSHCNYFLETLKAKDISKGKKLNFITQEIGREINTIGSKAYDADIQRLVVQMKDELEKIKEQTANVL